MNNEQLQKLASDIKEAYNLHYSFCSTEENFGQSRQFWGAFLALEDFAKFLGYTPVYEFLDFCEVVSMDGHRFRLMDGIKLVAVA